MATGTKVGSIVLLALCAGCASKTEFPEHPLGARTPLQEASEKTIKIDYAGEPGKGERPRVGLALSGGGTRAGMFAFGVLNGLNDTRVLDHVDVISSVSGGGYAAYWLYARRLEAQQAKTDYRLAFAGCRPDWWVKYDADPTNYSLLKQGGKKLLEYGEMVACTEKGDDEGQEWSGPADVYRWQAHISQSPDLFRKRRMVFGGTNGRGPDKEAIPVTAMSLFEMLRFPFVNNGYLGQSYEEGITRTWGLTPLPRTGRASDTVRYANAETDFTGGAYVAPGEHTWQKLRDLGKADSTVPLWIVNTTVLPKQSAPNEKAIFEVTQFSYGSEASGYVAIQEPAAGASGASSSGAVLHPEEIEELPKTVRASAAAADSQGFVTNHWRSADGFTKVLPALRWGVTVEDTNLGNVPVSYRLSDGGGSDNMGLISLVRRG